MSSNGIHPPAIAKLERHLRALRGLNSELRNNLELKGKSMANSLTSLFADGAQFREINSFNNIASYNVYAPLTINYIELTFMYKTHGILQTAIDMPVLDAFRGGVDIKSDELDIDDQKEITDRLEHTGLISTLTEVGCWARLYGGGGLIINTDQDPTTPLTLKKGMKLEFYAANRWELTAPNRWAEVYEFYGKRIHHSRVITIAGKAAPYLVKFVLQGWGMSEMERMIPDFNLYLRTKDVIYELLKEAKIDVYRFEGFNQSLATGPGTDLIARRLNLMNRAKAYNNAVVMDKLDEFEQKQITFSGLAEVHKQNMVYIASALRMPLTKLFGLSAAGFNSGEDDIENYNAMIESEVRQPMRPIVRQVLDLLCMQEFGSTFDLDFDYKPLRVLGEVEQETVKTQKFARYQSMFNAGLMDPKEYAEMLHAEDLIPIEPQAAKSGELMEMPGQEGDEDDDSGKDDKNGAD